MSGNNGKAGNDGGWADGMRDACTRDIEAQRAWTDQKATLIDAGVHRSALWNRRKV
ncbi:MAG: hypothetical protein HRT56_04945 [Coraliomargarita sp.]|nr:hypothetical protein [Coraliomargarita sp.]